MNRLRFHISKRINRLAISFARSSKLYARHATLAPPGNVHREAWLRQADSLMKDANRLWRLAAFVHPKHVYQAERR